MEYALDKAWQSGCYKVMLLTSKKDEPTLKFYEACGLESGIKDSFHREKALNISIYKDMLLYRRIDLLRFAIFFLIIILKVCTACL